MYDMIVIGAGAVGSATAYAAARAGVRVLLLEQFAIDHDRGSSHGASRIIRYVYDHPVYVEMAREAFPAWAALEQAADEQFYIRTGGIDFAPPGESLMRAMRASLTECAIPHTMMSADEAMRRYPQFRLDPEWEVLHQADTGALRASAAVRALVRLAAAHGATVRERTRVTAITVHDGSVSVTTECDGEPETFTGARLAIVGGAWLNGLIAPLGVHLPLRPIAPQENYFTGAGGVVDDSFLPGQFPVWIGHLQAQYGQIVYGIPSVDGSGVKIGLHNGAPIDPDTPDRTPDPALIESMRAFAERHIPGAAVHRWSRVCLYTNTPDEHFIIDTHPTAQHVVIASCCSGHGFKFAPVLGERIARLVLDGDAAPDLSLFRLSRFATP
jgi:sarcosine oxidase